MALILSWVDIKKAIDSQFHYIILHRYACFNSGAYLKPQHAMIGITGISRLLLILLTGVALSCGTDNRSDEITDTLPETIQQSVEEAKELNTEYTPLDSEMTAQEDEGPIGWVRGTFYDYDGTPIPMAQIDYQQRGHSRIWLATTYEGGRLDVSALPAGEYQVKAMHLPDHSRLPFVFQILDVTVTAGDILDIEIRLPETPHRFTEGSIHDVEGPAGWISGVLRDHNGNPVLNRQLRFWQQSSHEMWAVVTNDQGIFETDRLPVGNYMLSANYAPNPVGYDIFNRTLEMTVTEGDTMHAVISFEE